MARAIFFGNNFPFYDQTFVLPLQVNERLIKNDLLQLLLTIPGERVKQRSFGTLIKAFVFEPLTSDRVSELRDSIRTAIQVYEPRVVLKDIQFGTDPGGNLLSVSVLVSIRNEPNRVLEVVARFTDDSGNTRANEGTAITNG